METTMQSLDTIQSHVQNRSEESKISDDFKWELYSALLDPNEFDTDAFLQFDLREILEYIKESHQYFLNFSRKQLANLWLSQTNSPEVRLLLDTFLQTYLKFDKSLVSHIAEEDEYLIPYIEMLLKYQESSSIDYTLEDKIKLIDFIISHDDMPEKELLGLANELKSQKSISLRMMGEKLELLWRDLIVHSRIEEEVLLVKANKLEQLL